MPRVAYSGTVSGLTLSLVVDLHGGDRITGQITDGNWGPQRCRRIEFVFSKTHPTSFAGAYTIVADPGDSTMGTGIGTLTVDTLGNVKWKPRVARWNQGERSDDAFQSGCLAVVCTAV